MVKVSRFFIKDFDSSNIIYSQTSKYFRYKYDYTKLGVNNYTDQYNGYGGYVSAGNYKYSEEQGRYVVEDEDTIVRINIMGNVTTFNYETIQPVIQNCGIILAFGIIYFSISKIIIAKKVKN